MIALWSLFNKHRSDAGGLWIDVMMNMIGLAMISATIAGSVYLWLRKSIGAVAVRDPDLTLVQSCAGALWWLGVIIKFNSVKRMDRPLLESCNFVNFTLCHGFGFGVWAACVAFRLLRMHMIFERKSEFLRLGASIKLHVRRDKWKILAILWAPLALLWCFFMPAVGGSELIQLGRGSGERSYTTCIYSSFLWTFLDTIAVIGVWVLLIAAAHSMKDLDDGVGENKAIKKSIDFAVGALLILIFVEIFQLDGIWIGRTVVSLSVAASILLFFVAMNASELRGVTDNATLNAILKRRKQGGGDQDFEGGHVSSNSGGNGGGMGSSYQRGAPANQGGFGGDTRSKGLTQRGGKTKKATAEQSSEYVNAVLGKRA